MHYILWSIHSDFCWNKLEFNLILKFSWHWLSRLSWSVIEVQNCRPESFHFISSSRFVFSLGVVTLPSAASSFSLHRYSLDLLPPGAFFSLKYIAYSDLFTAFFIECATVDSSTWPKILWPSLSSMHRSVPWCGSWNRCVEICVHVLYIQLR